MSVPFGIHKRFESKADAHASLERTRKAYTDARAQTVVKPGIRLVRRLPPEVVSNVVAAEGPEVMTPAGDGYWRDQEKRYPFLKPNEIRHNGKATFCMNFGSSHIGKNQTGKRQRFVANGHELVCVKG